jgi:hypothetical protein
LETVDVLKMRAPDSGGCEGSVPPKPRTGLHYCCHPYCRSLKICQHSNSSSGTVKDQLKATRTVEDIQEGKNYELTRGEKTGGNRDGDTREEEKGIEVRQEVREIGRERGQDGRKHGRREKPIERENSTREKTGRERTTYQGRQEGREICAYSEK